DQVEHDVVVPPVRDRVDADLVDEFGYGRNLSHDRVGVNAGETAEQRGEVGFQVLNVRLHGVHVSDDGGFVCPAAHTPDEPVGGVVEDGADLGQVFMRCVGGRNASGELLRDLLEADAAVQGCQGVQSGVVFHDVEDLGLGVVDCGLGGRSGHGCRGVVDCRGE